MSALDDAITTLQADDAELAADVGAIKGALDTQATQIADLTAQIAALEAGGTVTPEQTAALAQVASDLQATHDAITGVLPAAPQTAVAPDAAAGSGESPTP